MTALDVYLRDCYGCRHVTRLGRMMSSDMTSLITIIHSIHGVEWDRLWKSYTSEYNPIWNVDGTEKVKETRDLKQGHTGKNTFTDSGSDSNVHSGVDERKNNGEDSNEIKNYVNGFDSASEVPESSSIETLTKGTGETLEHGEEIETKYGKKSTNERAFDDTDSGTVETETTRSGNIGVTMTQQMLEADLTYWTKVKAQFYRNVIQEIVDDITYSIAVDDHEMSDTNQSLIITALLNDGVPIAEVDTQTNTVNTLLKNGVPVAESEVKNG